MRELHDTPERVAEIKVQVIGWIRGIWLEWITERWLRIHFLKLSQKVNDSGKAQKNGWNIYRMFWESRKGKYEAKRK
jgi:hypothetical protein